MVCDLFPCYFTQGPLSVDLNDHGRELRRLECVIGFVQGLVDLGAAFPCTIFDVAKVVSISGFNRLQIVPTLSSFSYFCLFPTPKT